MNTLYINQIYGLFEDDKPLTDNKLFVNSYLKYTFICDNNNKNENRKYNYEYKLWNKESCEELLKKYPEFNYYYDVRFKVMRVDIMRFIILYEYPGIYSDMDIIPCIYDLDFIFDNYNNLYLCDYVNKKNNIYDIEIIGTAKKNNKLLYDYLRYIPSQIEEKNNIEIYKSWKMRYVFYTSGPRAFNKFLKQYFYSNNIISLNTILFDKGITNDAIPYDIVMEYYQIKFYSFHSQSYKEEIHEGKIVCTKYNNKKSEKKI
tara:strand:- start:349 stop:1125 length:777 start_codon:yes stop_codon:yes gene_type:complete